VNQQHVPTALNRSLRGRMLDAELAPRDRGRVFGTPVARVVPRGQLQEDLQEDSGTVLPGRECSTGIAACERATRPLCQKRSSLLKKSLGIASAGSIRTPEAARAPESTYRAAFAGHLQRPK
jgi:hypothetical protein